MCFPEDTWLPLTQPLCSPPPASEISGLPEIVDRRRKSKTSFQVWWPQEQQCWRRLGGQVWERRSKKAGSFPRRWKESEYLWNVLEVVSLSLGARRDRRVRRKVAVSPGRRRWKQSEYLWCLRIGIPGKASSQRREGNWQFLQEADVGRKANCWCPRR